MPSERSLNARGRATRVLEAGDGAPLIWLHDTLGNRWSPAQEVLSRQFRVIAPSLPGVEDSATLDGIDSAEDVVFWLLDLFEALQLTSTALLGCGLGGWMAAEFAVRYPSRVDKLVLVDAYGLRVEGALQADEFALTRPMLRPLLFADPDSDAAQELLPDSDPPERVEAGLHARVAAARLAWQFPYDRKLRTRLGRATMPALVVWGEADRLVSTAHAEAYHTGLPRARLSVIPGAGHFPYWETPEPFAARLSAFLVEER